MADFLTSLLIAAPVMAIILAILGSKPDNSANPS